MDNEFKATLIDLRESINQANEQRKEIGDEPITTLIYSNKTIFIGPDFGTPEIEQTIDSERTARKLAGLLRLDFVTK